MSLSYNDLTLLRYIQKRQMIPLSKTALHFQKNESSIRRTIEQINLYSSEPMVRIEKSICYSCISYEDLVSFIRNLDQKDYLSSSDERIRVMITAIFFKIMQTHPSFMNNGDFPLLRKNRTQHCCGNF